MQTTLKRLIAGALPTVVFLTLLNGSIVAASAQTPGPVPMPISAALEGCADNPKYWKESKWVKTQTTAALTWDPTDVPIRIARFQHVGYMRYYWKPCDYPIADLVKFEGFVYCAEKKDNFELPNMRGMKFNTYANNATGRARVNPPEDEMDWQLGAGNEGDVRCKAQNFKDSKWVYRISKPYWKFGVHVDLAAQHDDHVAFRYPSPDGYSRYLGYSADETLHPFKTERHLSHTS